MLRLLGPSVMLLLVPNRDTGLDCAPHCAAFSCRLSNFERTDAIARACSMLCCCMNLDRVSMRLQPPSAFSPLPPSELARAADVPAALPPTCPVALPFASGMPFVYMRMHVAWLLLMPLVASKQKRLVEPSCWLKRFASAIFLSVSAKYTRCVEAAAAAAAAAAPPAAPPAGAP